MVVFDISFVYFYYVCCNVFTELVSFVFSVPSFHVIFRMYSDWRCQVITIYGYLNGHTILLSSYPIILLALIVSFLSLARLGDRHPEALSPTRLGHKSEYPSRVGF